MGRLYSVQLVTADVDRQRAFYHERIGLEPARTEGGRVVFAPRGAALVLVPALAGEPNELRLALTAAPFETRLAALRAKGAKFEGEIVEDDLCRRIVVRDPEGNRVELVEPRSPLAPGRWPTLSHAIVNASRFEATVAFYRELLGLKVAEKDARWVTFDTGDTRLAVHDCADAERLALHADQKLAFALEDADFEAWTEELRARGVLFATAPAETDLGPQAEVEDADGWFVVLRGPAIVEPLDEEALASEFGDDDDEPHGPPRRGGELGPDGARRALPPAKLARKQAARASKTVAPEPERGGFVPRSGFGGSRPSSPRPYPPREGGPPRPPGPPREGAPRPYPPREGGPRSDAPRPAGPPRPPQGPGRPDRDRTE
jgi:catechol 2,3-dioxygenase-like lactoylglutathione lyase family enzyme